MDFCDERVARFAQRRREWLETRGKSPTSGAPLIRSVPGVLSEDSLAWKWWDSTWCDCLFVTLVIAVFGLFCWRFPCL